MKTRLHIAQQRAVLTANRELALLYWQIWSDILERLPQLDYSHHLDFVFVQRFTCAIIDENQLESSQ